MSRATLILTSDDIRAKATAWVRKAPPQTRVTFERPRRSVDQNALLWSRLGEVSRAVEWYGERLTSEEWKDVFTAALRKSRVVPGINGGFVVLGLRTSSMTKTEMTELLDLIDVFAAERGVELSS
jgi:hypothetical protein